MCKSQSVEIQREADRLNLTSESPLPENRIHVVSRENGILNAVPRPLGCNSATLFSKLFFIPRNNY